MVKTEDTTLVRISRENKSYIESKGIFTDSFNDILTRLLGLPESNKFMSEED